MSRPGMPFRATALAITFGLAAAAAANAATTADQTIDGNDRSLGYSQLHTAPGQPYVVRQELAPAGAGRLAQRRSLLYFGQLTDFQLADEESPARVEVIDPLANPGTPLSAFNAAWRPQEAMGPQVADQSIRQMNAYKTSPLTGAGGSHATMDFVITTGDSADSQQRNETRWVVRLLEGGALNPNSGSPNALDYLACPVGTGGTAEAAKYTGVQDYDDSLESPGFYDPDQPFGPWATWPQWTGLMDRAQKPFTAEGLDVPSYVVLGNHDALVQGNQGANLAFELVATGCIKIMAPVPSLDDPLAQLSPAYLQSLLATNPQQVALVPPDPQRQFVSKQQYRQLHFTGAQADGHGFGHVSPAELAASKGAAAYYAWSPKPGFKFIGLDTTSDAGITGHSAEGNIDAPQFAWLTSQIAAAEAANQLVVVFGHHPIRSLNASLPDEIAPPCLLAGPFGHDINAGCDVDPRSSSPIKVGADLQALLAAHPNVIAYVAGHTHENKVTAFPGAGGSGFWGIETASEADWPQQSRLLEIMDNKDGTLSIIGTGLNTAAPVATPAPGNAAGFSEAQLAAISREISYNDPQNGGGTGEGAPQDNNVELLLDDPRS
ncbi:MAG TPA: TIGR03767 family metallophosphoesterase [Solirubrobacteraceae bacterium]